MGYGSNPRYVSPVREADFECQLLSTPVRVHVTLVGIYNATLRFCWRDRTYKFWMPIPMGGLVGNGIPHFVKVFHEYGGA